MLDARTSDGILTLTVRRPERRNAIGMELARQMCRALQQVKRSPGAVRAVVICAEPVETRALPIWIAGGDQKEFRALPWSKASAFFRMMRQVCTLLEVLPLPTAALMDGRAIGGAAELALACDLRIATPRTVMEFPQLSIGLCTGFGGGDRLVRAIGRARAQQALFLGKPISAQTAHDWGLITALADNPIASAKLLSEILERRGTSMPAQKRLLSDRPPRGDQAMQSLWHNPAHCRHLESF